LTDIRPEIVALLNGLKARDELEELAKLFEESSEAWQQISEDERNRLIARAAALMSNRKV
jgi:acyl-CoA reductase-like NAD-dependent aldehyde dehydrogenase